jgi:hypothetical protein
MEIDAGPLVDDVGAKFLPGATREARSAPSAGRARASSLLFAIVGVVLALGGNSIGSVVSVYWTGEGLSLFGLMVVQLAGLGACFFVILAAVAASTRDWRVVLPHSLPSQRRLFCLGTLCARATRRGACCPPPRDAADDADDAADALAEAPPDAADGGAPAARWSHDALTQTELLFVMGAINMLSAVTQLYATPPDRTPPVLQALLPCAMVAASPPISKALLLDRKTYLSPAPIGAALLISAALVVSLLPSFLVSSSDAAPSPTESSPDEIAWSIVFFVSMLLSAVAIIYQQLYLIRAGTLVEGVSSGHTGVAMLRALAYNQVLVFAYLLPLFWLDVLPWWGSSSGGVGGFFKDVGFAIACSLMGPAGLGGSASCPSSTPTWFYSYLFSYVFYLYGTMMVARDSAVFNALLNVAMTGILAAFWLFVPSANPDPDAAATPTWSVVASFLLSSLGILVLKRWESGEGEVADQFGVCALECERRVIEAAVAAAAAAKAGEQDEPLLDS